MNIKDLFNIFQDFGFKLKEPVKQLDDRFYFSQWDCEKVSSKKIDVMILILNDQIYTRGAGVRVTEDYCTLAWVFDKKRVVQEIDFDE